MKRLSSLDQTFHQQFYRYGRNAKEWLRKCALLLPEIDRRRIWKKKGFTSIYEYAAKLAGMSQHSVREALRVMRHIEDKPALKQIVEERGIHAVRPVVTIATPETDSFWAEKAREMSVRTLETYARDYRRESHHVMTSQPENSLKIVELSLSSKLAAKLESFKKRADFDALLERFINEVEKEDFSSKPEPFQTNSRYIPAAIRHYIQNRSGGTCEFPGCFKQGAAFHHTKRWASENVHDPSHVRLLCKAHHELAHLSLIQNENNAPHTWELIKTAAHRIHPIDQKVFSCRQIALFRGG